MHTSSLFTVIRSRAAWGAGLALAATMLPGCTQAQRQGLAASYLMIDSIQAARGSAPDKFGGTLASDVVTRNSVYADLGQVTLRLGLKDPGSLTSPAQPTSTNFITVTRYHVRFVRSDGRNTQGVDVPYEFDGGATATIGLAPTAVIVTLVRSQAKVEAPLVGLINGNGAYAISTIAEITLYGTDQAGREVSVTGLISVDFADWAD